MDLAAKKSLSFLIKPASSLCNMRCRYCFYDDVSSCRTIKSYGIMQTDITQRILQQIISEADNGSEITFAFQGGEPTLAGLSYFENFVQTAAELNRMLQKNIMLRYTLQTNGLLLDDMWCSFLADNDFLVGLSLDGSVSFHDENRKDAEGNGTFRSVMEAKDCLERHNTEYNVMWVLTNHHARFPKKTWTFMCSHGIQYVQFIPCLAEISGAQSDFALTPERFASFYIALFRLWAEALSRGEYRSVKLFDDVCNLYGKGTVTSCGLTGKCHPQFVIEADGSVYPCDFYVLDEWRTGMLTQSTMKELICNETMIRFLQRPKKMEILCTKCKFENICHGGCPRMRNSMYLSEDRKTCGYRTFLTVCGSEIQTVAQRYVR